MKYWPGEYVTIWRPPRWDCEGSLHHHRSEDAAARCEARGYVTGKRVVRTRNADGTFTVSPRWEVKR